MGAGAWTRAWPSCFRLLILLWPDFLRSQHSHSPALTFRAAPDPNLVRSLWTLAPALPSYRTSGKRLNLSESQFALFYKTGIIITTPTSLNGEDAAGSRQ